MKGNRRVLAVAVAFLLSAASASNLLLGDSHLAGGDAVLVAVFGIAAAATACSGTSCAVRARKYHGGRWQGAKWGWADDVPRNDRKAAPEVRAHLEFNEERRLGLRTVAALTDGAYLSFTLGSFRALLLPAIPNLPVGGPRALLPNKATYSVQYRMQETSNRPMILLSLLIASSWWWAGSRGR